VEQKRKKQTVKESRFTNRAGMKEKEEMKER